MLEQQRMPEDIHTVPLCDEGIGIDDGVSCDISPIFGGANSGQPESPRVKGSPKIKSSSFSTDSKSHVGKKHTRSFIEYQPQPAQP